MPLLKKWIENGALFAIWRVEETAEELRKMLVASLPYDEELSQLKSEARQLEYLAVRVLLRAVCGEEKHISHYSSGKPFLTDGSFHITISHTRGYVAVGLHATYEVGVDIEYISQLVPLTSAVRLKLEWNNTKMLQKINSLFIEQLIHGFFCRPLDKQISSIG